MDILDKYTIDHGVVDGLIADLKTELSSCGVTLEGARSVANYIAIFDSIPQPSSYSHVPIQARRLLSDIEATGGHDAVDAFLRLVLLTLAGQFEQRAAALSLPTVIHDRATDFLAKLLLRLQRPVSRRYGLDSDTFLKDLGVLRLKLWPGGAELVDMTSGIPRGMLLQAGIGQGVKTLGQITFFCGGLKPFFESHFDKRFSQGFSPAGYTAFYLTIADLLRQHPTARGLFSGSWWHDPALVDISPNLAFLNDIAVAGGARLFPMGTSDEIVAQATRLSKERAERVQEGSYRPTGYMLVWARDDLLHWAETQKAPEEREGMRRSA